jgi:hypothetical protein
MGISFGDLITVFSGPVGLLQRRFGGGSGSLSGLPPIVLGKLNGMDVQGEQILGTYLYGGGETQNVYDDPDWSEYMMAHPVLQGTLINRVRDVVTSIASRKKPDTYPIGDKFHFAFPENNNFSGYALLHGSNAKVGDFLMAGTAEVTEAKDQGNGAYDIELNLRFIFNDIVDPNGDYFMDRVRSIAAILVTVGLASDYRLSIHWGSKCLAKVRPGKDIVYSGYPFDRTK